MIQRLQTLYLAGATLLLIFWFFSPLATFLVGGEEFSFGIMGFSTQNSGSENIYLRTWPLLVLTCITTLISLIAIFIYKRRMIQIRLCIFNLVSLLGLMGLLVFYVFQVQGAFEATAQHGAQLVSVVTKYSVVDVFPLVAALLTLLALRRIAKDEALVRSMDRLR